VECIIFNSKAGKKEGFLTPIEKGDRPLMTYHIDHVGPMEMTSKRYNHILAIVDGFSKFVWLYPTRSTGAEEVISCLERQATNFGNPLRIISDRGTAFTAQAFKLYCEEQKIQHLVITTGVPRGNGQVERMHKTVVSMLSKLSHESAGDWYKHVSKVQQIINSTPPRSTLVSPFKILTGIEMRLPNDLELNLLIKESLVMDLDEERELVRATASENIKQLQTENKRVFDLKRKGEIIYKIDDLVAIKRTQYGTGLKLKGKFLGPYKIVKVNKHVRYDVEKLGDDYGPFKTSTVAEYMKPWGNSFGSNDVSGGPIVGNEPDQRTKMIDNTESKRERRSGNAY